MPIIARVFRCFYNRQLSFRTNVRNLPYKLNETIPRVYIIANITKTVLYTEMTNDLSKRSDQHRLAENTIAFTAKYGANRLLYFEEFQDVWLAI